MKAIHKPTIMETITLGSKTAPEIKARVKMLGDMNDRYMEASGSRDKKTLRALAAEYEALGWATVYMTHKEGEK